MTPRQAQLIRSLATDHHDWNHAMWGLHNEGYTPEEIRDAMDALDELAGNKLHGAESDLEDYTPQ